LVLLIAMIGTNCMFTFESLRSHIRASKGSRLSVECGDLRNYPISSRGYKPKRVGYHRLPNVALITCHLQRALGHRMTIYISFTGVERLRESNFYYREEMAVINTALNLAVSNMKTLAADNPEFQVYADQIGKLSSHETKVKGDFAANLVNRTESLGPGAMGIFARQFDLAFASLQNGRGLDFCMDPKLNGMRYNKGESLLKREYVAKAIKALNQGHYFTANLAGIKNTYKERDDFTMTMNEAFYATSEPDRQFEDGSDINELIQEFVSDKVKQLYTELRTDIFKMDPDLELPLNEVYFFDIGVEFTSLDEDLDLVSLATPGYEMLDKILKEP
jgi:hypothetical protein